MTARSITITLLLMLSLPYIAQAQEFTLDLGTGRGFTEGIVQLLAVITIVALAPSILVMTTCFVRIVVVLSLLRTAIGLQQSPPNTVIVSLALFLTAFVMAPVFTDSWKAGLGPFINGELELEDAMEPATRPLTNFMLAHTSETDLELFASLAQINTLESPQHTPFYIVAPAFMISELKRAFEIGFLIFLPFLIIDLVVASLLMSMGMMMLPPVTVSLPFKLIFFVLIDGWRLLSGSLVESFVAGPPG